MYYNMTYRNMIYQHLADPKAVFIKSNLYKYRARLMYYNNVLPKLETHLVDHCNLNCKGCSHFSPLSSPAFADYNQFSKDITRLSELFKNINRFRILGGEPLLHPEISKFISFARMKLPASNIRIVTNGVLLPKMTPLFWETIADSKVSIDITVYPKVPVRVDTIKTIAKKYDINLAINYPTRFRKIPKNFNGDCNIKKSLDICRGNFYCPFLRDGRIYLCAHMTMFKLLENTFDITPPPNVKPIEGINIHENITGKEIINYTLKPQSCCGFCNWEKRIFFPWDISKRKEDEWI